jgi:hypothetical protein
MNIFFQGSAHKSETITTASKQILPRIIGGLTRTQLIITNTSTTATATITKGETIAVAGQGVVLQPNQSYIEATDGGYICFQGEVQAVGSANGTLSITESFIEGE